MILLIKISFTNKAQIGLALKATVKVLQYVIYGFY